MLTAMPDITRLLDDARSGDPRAAADLLPLVYAELRRLAAVQVAREQPGQTLDATALVHEAYLRLVGASRERERPEEERPPVAHAPGSPEFANSRHFYAAAAEAMRRILVEIARRKRTVKHGGSRRRVPLDESLCAPESPDDLLALDDALTRLAERAPDKAELVKLRFFAGLSTPQAAAALGISVATAERWWVYARTWLYAELSDTADEKSPDP
jgi:RNA polymerase sigma factor (sigma-70 family)